MKTTHDFKTESTTPAPLPEVLQSRLLAAMNQAADEERDCREMEQLLRRLRPSALPAGLAGRLGVQMYVESSRNERPARRSYWLRGSAAVAAALLVFAVSGVAFMLPGSAVAENENQGLVSRNIIESRSTNRVEWRRGEAPVRHYQVIYEDAFVLDDEGTTTVIRVPNTTEVEVEEDYL